MGYEKFLVHMEDQIAVVSFNRPESFNALSKGLLMEFRELLKELEANQSVRVVILTGAGDRAFVAGADIMAFKTMTEQELEEGGDCRGKRVRTRGRFRSCPGM